MKIKLLFFAILLVASLAFSFVGITFLNWKIHYLFGFQFLSFAIAGTFIYTLKKFFRFIDSLIFILFYTILVTLYLVGTEIVQQIGGVFHIFLYSLAIYLPLVFLLGKFWELQLPKYVKNIVFSLVASVFYTFIHIIIYLLLKEAITVQILKLYFYNYLIIFLIISLAFTVSEILFLNIEKFFTPPEIRR